MAGPNLQVSVAESLTLALIASSDAPLLLLDGNLWVIAASTSFGSTFHIDVGTARGVEVCNLGAGEWNLPRLRSLLSATAAGDAAIDAYEMDLNYPDSPLRRLVIKAEKLAYGDPNVTRILMTVCDVTDARLAERVRDDLVREKAVLLNQIQHRITDSLQVIASVLLQSARNVQLDNETRSHLTDAHSRVMSVATVQQHLAAARIGPVELRPYFVQLCQSLGASMIRDHNRQSITATIDNTYVDADISVSLGLIITELVINALKHAFADGDDDRIFVDYESRGANWTLSVRDNGIGMPPEPTIATPGLGSSIVEALARQLDATVMVTSRRPGTKVSVIHAQVAAIEDGAPIRRAV